MKKEKKVKPFIFRAWMIGMLRKISYRYAPRYNTLNAARVSRGVYKCSVCPEGSNHHPRRGVQVDHTIPVVNPETGFPKTPDGRDDWTVFIERLFITEEGFSVMCKMHHSEKTKREGVIRRQHKKNSVDKKGAKE